jgi:hypothetical protein
MIITRRNEKRLITVWVGEEPKQQVIEKPYYEAEQKVEGLYYTGTGRNRFEAIADCLNRILYEKYDELEENDPLWKTGGLSEEFYRTI